MKKNKFFSILVILALLMAAVPVLSAGAAGTVIVTPSSLNSWIAYDDGFPGGATNFVTGPSGVPIGSGSLQFTLSGTARMLMGTPAYAGTKLNQITALQYSTYRGSADAGNLLAVALQFDMDYDLTDATTTWQSRLVFEPYFTAGSGNIPQNTWHTWSPLVGKWWMAGIPIVANAPVTNPCPQSSPCEWNTVLGHFPEAGLRANVGMLWFKAGGPWASFSGNVDAFTIGVNYSDTTYNFEPALGACAVNVDLPNTTLTLLSNCFTDQTIYVPDGWTLDGDGYSITAVDPSGGHFLGAVIRNAGISAHVTNLTVTTSNLANVCDGDNNRLRGILFDGAGGSITNNTVLNVNQGASGCQEGNGIEVRNAPFDNTGVDLLVTISDNTVTNYQKNGITANGSVAATITDNIVTGAGPVNYIAQNGIQVGFGGTAVLRGNTVSGNDYTPSSFVACGILYFQSDGVKASANARFSNERDQCNFGKGGGNYNPSP